MCGRSCVANADAHWHMEQRAHTYVQCMVAVRFEIGCMACMDTSLFQLSASLERKMGTWCYIWREREPLEAQVRRGRH
jgi:hypothetical protein